MFRRAAQRLSTRPFSVSSFHRADPWLLPNTPEHLASTTIEDVPPTPLHRPNESPDKLRARLVYQSRKRGTLESDLLLSTFARDNLSGMGEAEMKEYDKVCGTALLPFFAPLLFLLLIVWQSFWMRQIGTFTTGPLDRGHGRNAGPIRPFLKDWRFMRETRGKLFAGCLLCNQRSILALHIL